MSKPTPQCFFIGSFGRSGTVWLSKLLNSHPDVLCFHEGAILNHQPNPWYESGAKETMQWIRGLRDAGRWNVGLLCYRAIGDVNSIGGYHRVCPFENEFYRASTHYRLAEALSENPLFVITREPVLAIESKHRMLQLQQNLYFPYAEEYLRRVLAGVHGLDREWIPAVLASPSATLRVMLMLHWRFVAQLECAATFQLEDIGGDPTRAAAAAAEISGVADGWESVSANACKAENVGEQSSRRQSPGEIFATWSAHERAAFNELCAQIAHTLGYETPTYGRESHCIVPWLDRPSKLPEDFCWSTSGSSGHSGNASPNVAVWGTGRAGMVAWEALSALDIIPAYFVDSDPERQGKRFLASEVLPPDELRKRPNDRIIIATMYREEVGRQMADLCVGRERAVFPDLWAARPVVVRQLAQLLGIETVE